MKKLFLLVSFLFFGLGFGQNLNPAEIDMTFNLDTDKTKLNGFGYHSLVQNDGKIVLFGSFTGLQKISGEVITKKNIIRLNSDLTVDTSFYSDASIVGTIRSVGLQSDGKMIVFGNIVSVNGFVLGQGGGSAIVCFRLNANGTYDATFNNSGNTYNIQIQSDNKILFTNAGNQTTRRLNSNGTFDFGFQNVLIALVNSPNNKKYYMSQQVDINHNLLKLSRVNDNGTDDIVFNNDINPSTTVQIIRSQPQLTNAQMKVAIKTLPDNKILVYGNFGGVVGSSTNSKKIIRINSDGKTLDTTFSSEQLNLNDPDNLNVVSDIINLPNGKLIVVINYFQNQTFPIQDNYVTKIIRLNADGSIDPTFVEGTFGIIANFNPNSNIQKPQIVPLSNNEILIIKNFDDENYTFGINRISYNGFYTQDNYFKIGTDGNQVYTQERDQNIYTNAIIKDSNDNICLIGHSRINALYHRGIKLLNNNGVPVLNNNLKIGFKPAINNIENTEPLSNCLAAVRQTDGKLIVGGRFTEYNGQIANRLVRLNTDYSIDQTFNIGTGIVGDEDGYSNYVDNIVIQPDGKILISGYFDSFNGNPITSNIIRLNNDGTIDTSFNFNAEGSVVKFLVQPDGKILISAFGYGFIRLNNDGSVDNTFVYNGNGGFVDFFLQSNGKIVVCNNYFFKRLDENGNVEFTSPDFDVSGGKFYLQSDNKIIAISYAPVFNSTISRINRINSDGIIDASFNAGIGFNGYVKSVLMEEDGNILVAGDFTRYNGAWCNGIVRLLGGNGYVVQGEAKIDYNNNGCDANDIYGKNIKFRIADGINNFDIISNTSGNYFIPTNSGNYTITPTFENPSYFTVSPTNISVSFPTQLSPVIQDFCITPNGLHPDLEITLLPLTVARPGFEAKYRLVYKNKGNQLQSGIVNFNFNDAVLNFVSATTAVSSQTLNNLNWNFTNLMPLETREITITLNVNSPTATPPVNSGFVLNYTTSVSSTLTDEMPSDNTFTFNQTVVNSFDPNDKTCIEGATIATTKVGDYVHYMIRFENTGSYNAQNITVKDVIDTTKYDINTLLPTSGSHSFVTRILEGNRAEFYFENINLPFADATNDGYVAFKIKTKSTLGAGDSFSNSAGIYFDYNYPITTNTATTTITALSSQDFTFNDYFSVYPNPVENNLNIIKKEEIEISSITIYNLLGQIVVAIPNAKNVENVDVSSLKSGNYFVKINSNKGTSNTKFIKL